MYPCHETPPHANSSLAILQNAANANPSPAASNIAPAALAASFVPAPVFPDPVRLYMVKVKNPPQNSVRFPTQPTEQLELGICDAKVER